MKVDSPWEAPVGVHVIAPQPEPPESGPELAPRLEFGLALEPESESGPGLVLAV